jgi:NAD(P)-dependent dehydrogenase (short-subunit alcohol dehydrogenase family)
MANEAHLPHRPADDRVVLITHAGSDVGYRLARELLRSGCRVAVTSRHTTDLTRILHGYNGNQVFAVAAITDDQRQYEQLLRRVRGRFGHVDSMIDAVTGQVTTVPADDLVEPRRIA